MINFDEQFSKPVKFTNGVYIITGEVSREEAALKFSQFLIKGRVVNFIHPTNLTKDCVEYGPVPDLCGGEPGDKDSWFTGSFSENRRLVWVLAAKNIPYIN
jgi:hypothetical protein